MFSPESIHLADCWAKTDPVTGLLATTASHPLKTDCYVRHPAV